MSTAATPAAAAAHLTKECTPRVRAGIGGPSMDAGVHPSQLCSSAELSAQTYLGIYHETVSETPRASNVNPRKSHGAHWNCLRQAPLIGKIICGF